MNSAVQSNATLWRRESKRFSIRARAPIRRATIAVYMMDNNFTFSKEVLHFALARRIPLVYASSAAVYGGSTAFAPAPENERPLNLYGVSKLAFDNHVRGLIANSQSVVAGLRYFNVYGPRESHKGKMASMVYQLYRQLKTSGRARLFTGYRRLC